MLNENPLLQAQREKKAIGAFNYNTYDEMEAIVQAAKELNRPVMLMASMSCCHFMGISMIVQFCHLLEQKYCTQVIIHLDHCTDINLLYQCVDAGFDFVMFDGSHRPYEENKKMTSEIVKKCHEKGVFVEGELGVLYGKEGPVKSDRSVFTDPEQMVDYISATHIDAMAVSIGNAHGFYNGTPHIEFELLEKLAKVSTVPLVLHGGTGIPVQDISRAVHMGICKVNVGTDIRHTYLKAISDYGKNWDGGNDIRGCVNYIRTSVKEKTLYYMESYS